MDVEHIGPRRQTEIQINVRVSSDIRMQDCRLMGAAQPGCKTTVCGTGCFACLPLGDMSGVLRDGGGRRGWKQGREYESQRSAPEGRGCRCGHRWGSGTALQGGPQRPN